MYLMIVNYEKIKILLRVIPGVTLFSVFCFHFRFPKIELWQGSKSATMHIALDNSYEL